MKKAFNYTIIVPLVKAKYKNAAHGSYIHRDGKLYFKSGKNIVYIREHFTDSGATPERLIENTVRYDSANSPAILENRNVPCYNDKVNDVL